MGTALTYLEEPVRDKELLDGSATSNGRYIRHGTCEMQGWRVNMEDAHLAVPDLDEHVSLYGVFDGHGGRGVSRFAARELPRILKETEGWKAGDYKTALEQAFLEVDEQLRSDTGRKAVEELDKPDPQKPRRLLQVPRRMVERFRQGQASAGDEDEIDLDNPLDDDYFEIHEGEEEDGLNFEADPEMDEPEAEDVKTADAENLPPPVEIPTDLEPADEESEAAAAADA